MEEKIVSAYLVYNIYTNKKNTKLTKTNRFSWQNTLKKVYGNCI